MSLSNILKKSIDLRSAIVVGLVAGSLLMGALPARAQGGLGSVIQQRRQNRIRKQLEGPPKRTWPRRTRRLPKVLLNSQDRPSTCGRPVTASTGFNQRGWAISSRPKNAILSFPDSDGPRHI